MVVNKRSKSTRYRGSRRHGHGRIHRKSGTRGGKGHAGIGKRGKSHKPSVSKSGRKLGRNGFTSKSTRQVKSINIKEIETKLRTWESKQLVGKEGDAYLIKLNTLGYGKLLSTGAPQHKLKITVAQASKAATEKIAAAGGQVETLA